MTTVACPYCYHRIELGKLLFQCSGRPAPGFDRCPKETDPARAKLTGYTASSFPTFPPPESRSPLPARKAPCPACHGDSGIRACQICHTPLPANFADSRSPLIGLVGGKSSGKTVYMTVLVHELRNNIRKRFGADISFADEQQGGAGADGGWLAAYERALFDNSALFEGTASVGEVGIKAPLVVQWRREKRNLIGRGVFSTTTLSFYDAAGEDMTTQEFVNGQAYLCSSDGLIVLLDPFMFPGARDHIDVPDAAVRAADAPLTVLTRITNLLRTSQGVSAKKKITTPIAVVFSKIDAFYDFLGGDHPLLRQPTAGATYDEANGRDTDEHLRALLDKLGADDVDSHLRSHYKNFRYFAVSALGAEPDYQLKTVDSGGIRPFRVDEPLLWLLGRFRIIETSGA